MMMITGDAAVRRDGQSATCPVTGLDGNACSLNAIFRSASFILNVWNVKSFPRVRDADLRVCHGSSPPGLYPSIRVRTAPPVSVRVRVRVSVSFTAHTVLHVSKRYVKDRVVNFHDRPPIYYTEELIIYIFNQIRQKLITKLSRKRP